MDTTTSKLILIVAPSGTGKSTLIKQLLHEVTDLFWSVSYTTRQMRPGEHEGKDYIFTDKATFQSMIQENGFVEWANVHGNFYGTARHTIDKMLKEKKHTLLDVDTQGADNILKDYSHCAQAIYIAPPSHEDLEKRLRQRATESEESLQLRLVNAKRELKRQDDYNFKVVNDNIDRCYKDLKNIVLKIIKG